ncbi:MAG: hypothetical protein ACLUGA_07785 [Oscillospiraceae bacterium]
MTSFERNAIIIGQICDVIEPGKKMLQKMMYLIERQGVNLELKYSIHFFGPYSSKLDETIHILESNDRLVIDTSGVTHIIHKGIIPIEGHLDIEDQEKTDFVIEHFSNKSALDMEAITTLDYVANKMLGGTKDEEEIISKVKKIKGSKFSEARLTENLHILKDLHYI